MLVLTRHRDESVICGDEDIKVTVVDLRGDKVRLGFTAAPDYPIHREEVFEAVKREQGVITAGPSASAMRGEGWPGRVMRSIQGALAEYLRAPLMGERDVERLPASLLANDPLVASMVAAWRECRLARDGRARRGA